MPTDWFPKTVPETDKRDRYSLLPRRPYSTTDLTTDLAADLPSNLPADLTSDFMADSIIDSTINLNARRHRTRRFKTRNTRLTSKHWGRRMVLLLALGTLLMGCTDVSEPEPTEPSAPEASVPAETEITLNGPGQLLEPSAIAQIKSETFQLEVAQTPQQQALGLMFRSELPANRGMLFPFSSPRRASFWMKDVPVGLDMVFIRAGRVVEVVTAPPCTAEPCETYGPANNQIVDSVLELRAGRAAEIDLQPGDAINIQIL